MEVLIIGGKQSEKLQDHLSTTKNANYSVAPYIQDILVWLNKGGTADKVLVFDDAITQDNTITDETAIYSAIEDLVGILDVDLPNTTVTTFISDSEFIKDALYTETFNNYMSSERFLIVHKHHPVKKDNNGDGIRLPIKIILDFVTDSPQAVKRKNAEWLYHHKTEQIETETEHTFSCDTHTVGTLSAFHGDIAIEEQETKTEETELGNTANFDNDFDDGEPVEIYEPDEDEPEPVEEPDEDEPDEIEIGYEPEPVEDEPTEEIDIEDEPQPVEEPDEDELEPVEDEPIEIDYTPEPVEDEPTEEQEDIEIMETDFQDDLDSLYATQGETENNLSEHDLDIYGKDDDMDIYTEPHHEEPVQPIHQEVDHEEEPKRKFGFNRTKKKKDTPIRDRKDDLIKALNTYRNRGASIVITGTHGSGKSIMAFNIANIVSRLGFSALIVDMDTKNKAQAYLNKDAYDAVHSLDTESASLKQALNTSTSGAGGYAAIIREGFHVLTMGLAGDIVTGDKLAPRAKLSRFSNNIRNNYTVIIYDMPFDVATDYASEITITSDRVVIACEQSNYALMNLMIGMCNIENEDMHETMFSNTQLCITKYKGWESLLGKKVSSTQQALALIDNQVESLLGIDPEFYFSQIPVCMELQYSELYENTWHSNTAYSDSKEGASEYIELLLGILNR